MKSWFEDNEITYSFYVLNKKTELELALEDYPIGG